jgi:pSer/pThr/pTyr-binding forkhead associated (FHA) protein
MNERAEAVTTPGRRLFALRAMAGPYRGAVIPLEPGEDIVLGRSSEADVVLDEELMSRRHASISWEDGSPVVQDLRSTNGTFVNGQRVERGRLVHGDRLHVGANILKLVAEFVPVALAEARARQGRPVQDEPSAAVQGRLDDVPLPDLLQLLGATGKSGVLRLRRGVEGAEIHLLQGSILRCAVAGQPAQPARAALRHLLGWTTGAFDLDPPATPSGGEPQRVEALLLDVLREADEQARPDGAARDSIVWPEAE